MISRFHHATSFSATMARCSAGKMPSPALIAGSISAIFRLSGARRIREHKPMRIVSLSSKKARQPGARSELGQFLLLALCKVAVVLDSLCFFDHRGDERVYVRRFLK